ncbi:MAG TPA: amino acid racemase [Gaiellaceae bacterium]|nr:amino acid racemase [Gaiellaceae bacterium]
MRTVGVLGGITWHSAAEYYRLLNSLVAERTGGVHAARCVLVSVDIGEIDPLMHAGRWEEAAELVARDARAVEAAGADVFVLACNSLHTVWEPIVSGLSIPAIHIADAAADELDGRQRVALLGTPWTMELPFFRDRLAARGFEVVVPAEADRESLGRSVFDELSHGIVRDETRALYIELIERLGVDAVVLACTEMTLLQLQDDVDVPLVDTARAHAQAAVDYALYSV